MAGDGRVTSLPFKNTCSVVGGIKCASVLKRVAFPVLVGPMIEFIFKHLKANVFENEF